MKLLIQDSENKIITRYQVFEGNPNDDTLLVPAVDAHIAMFGRAPKSVAADRGFASPKNESMLCAREGSPTSLFPARARSMTGDDTTSPCPGSRSCNAGEPAKRPRSAT